MAAVQDDDGFESVLEPDVILNDVIESVFDENKSKNFNNYHENKKQQIIKVDHKNQKQKKKKRSFTNQYNKNNQGRFIHNAKKNNNNNNNQNRRNSKNENSESIIQNILNTNEDNSIVYILMNHNYSGGYIGKRGCNISKIRESTGTNIYLQDRTLKFSENIGVKRILKIRGSRKSMKLAIEITVKRLLEIKREAKMHQKKNINHKDGSKEIATSFKIMNDSPILKGNATSHLEQNKQNTDNEDNYSSFEITLLSPTGVVSQKYNTYKKVNIMECGVWELITIWGKLHDVSAITMKILGDQLGKIEINEEKLTTAVLNTKNNEDEYQIPNTVNNNNNYNNNRRIPQFKESNKKNENKFKIKSKKSNFHNNDNRPKHKRSSFENYNSKSSQINKAQYSKFNRKNNTNQQRGNRQSRKINQRNRKQEKQHREQEQSNSNNKSDPRTTIFKPKRFPHAFPIRAVKSNLINDQSPVVEEIETHNQHARKRTFLEAASKSPEFKPVISMVPCVLPVSKSKSRTPSVNSVALLNCNESPFIPVPKRISRSIEHSTHSSKISPTFEMVTDPSPEPPRNSLWTTTHKISTAPTNPTNVKKTKTYSAPTVLENTSLIMPRYPPPPRSNSSTNDVHSTWSREPPLATIRSTHDPHLQNMHDKHDSVLHNNRDPILSNIHNNRDPLLSNMHNNRDSVLTDMHNNHDSSLPNMHNNHDSVLTDMHDNRDSLLTNIHDNRDLSLIHVHNEQNIRIQNDRPMHNQQEQNLWPSIMDHQNKWQTEKLSHESHPPQNMMHNQMNSQHEQQSDQYRGQNNSELLQHYASPVQPYLSNTSTEPTSTHVTPPPRTKAHHHQQQHHMSYNMVPTSSNNAQYLQPSYATPSASVSSQHKQQQNYVHYAPHPHAASSAGNYVIARQPQASSYVSNQPNYYAVSAPAPGKSSGHYPYYATAAPTNSVSSAQNYYSQPNTGAAAISTHHQQQVLHHHMNHSPPMMTAYHHEIQNGVMHAQQHQRMGVATATHTMNYQQQSSHQNISRNNGTMNNNLQENLIMYTPSKSETNNNVPDVNETSLWESIQF